MLRIGKNPKPDQGDSDNTMDSRAHTQLYGQQPRARSINSQAPYQSPERGAATIQRERFSRTVTNHLFVAARPDGKRVAVRVT